MATFCLHLFLPYKFIGGNCGTSVTTPFVPPPVWKLSTSLRLRGTPARAQATRERERGVGGRKRREGEGRKRREGERGREEED